MIVKVSKLGLITSLHRFFRISQVTYCEVLAKYRSDLARPFDEATTFLNSVEKQLSDLCKDSVLTSGGFFLLPAFTRRIIEIFGLCTRRLWFGNILLSFIYSAAG